jgi:hypothetical protein
MNQPRQPDPTLPVGALLILQREQIADLKAELKQCLETIRNQNREMEWLKGQLRESGARERAYVEIINRLTYHAGRAREEARTVLEGNPQSSDRLTPEGLVTEAVIEPVITWGGPPDV